jgi:hypothetical protein
MTGPATSRSATLRRPGGWVAPISNDGAGNFIWNDDDIVTVAAPTRRRRLSDFDGAAVADDIDEL